MDGINAATAASNAAPSFRRWDIMCGPFAWGFWWILPVIGIVACLGMFLLASRRGSGGLGCPWMAGHRDPREDGARQTEGPGGAR